MATVEAWQAGHDKLCAQRYGDIEKALTALGSNLGGLRTSQNKGIWLAVSILVALVSWMGAQLYNGLQADIHRSQMAPAAASESVKP